MNQDQAISRDYNSTIREERAAQTRATIVSSARRLFSDAGYAQTTLAAIAKDAGVSTQTIYNSVGGKQEVLLAVVELVNQIAGIEDALAQMSQSDDPEEVIRLTVATRRRAIEGAVDILGVFLEAAASEPAIEQAARERAAGTRSRCRNIASRLDEMGGLRGDLDVDQASDALYALLHHAIWQRLSQECGWPLSAIESWLVDVVRRAVLEDA